MKRMITVAALAASLGGPMAARTTPVEAAPRPQEAAASETLAANGCASTGCPKQDQHGHPPVQCEFKSSMATGWQCLLICHYADSKWGTTIDASNCK